VSSLIPTRGFDVITAQDIAQAILKDRSKEMTLQIGARVDKEELA
jgi:hypothetical protein